ncbi:hypothetical protein DFH11DRAFT_1616968 [Phellopilus nigrolimitatus]|nr:hypothetical protein DFH11DRAFT_1616968 [Phellopilus nigrolimitatus]
MYHRASTHRHPATIPSLITYYSYICKAKQSKYLRSLLFLLRLLHLPQHFDGPDTREEGGEALLLRLPLQRVTGRQQAANDLELFFTQRRLVQLDGGAEPEVAIRAEALDVHVCDGHGHRRYLVAHFAVHGPEHELALEEFRRWVEELTAREQNPEVHGIAWRVIREADVDGHAVESLERLYEHRGRGCKRAEDVLRTCASLCTALPLHCKSTELQSCEGRLSPWHLLLGADLSACVLLCIKT